MTAITSAPCLQPCGPYYEPEGDFCGLPEGHKGNCNPTYQPTLPGRPIMSDNLKISHTWVVVHDAMPDPVEFVYHTEAEAREVFDRSKFYDPANRWGVSLVHRVHGSEVLATTYPQRGDING